MMNRALVNLFSLLLIFSAQLIHAEEVDSTKRGLIDRFAGAARNDQSGRAISWPYRQWLRMWT